MRRFVFVVFLAACGGSAPPPVVVAPTPAPVVEPPPVVVAEPPPPPPLRAVPPPKVALVLGGGGARGFAHVGILRVLEHEKIPLSLVVGTSVGSLIGALYASQPNTFELEWKAFEIQKEDIFDFSFLSSALGPVKGEAIQEFVKTHVKLPNIEQFPMPFVAVAADLNTGERVELDRGSIVDAVRASTAIPGVFTPAHIGTRWLVDGGVVANVAVDVARARGADIVIAVNISQDVVNYRVGSVVDVILQSINIMMDEMTKHDVKTADVLIAPKIGDVGTLDFTQKKRCMEAGINATRAALPALKQALVRYYKDRGGAVPPNVDALPDTTGPVASP